MLSYVLFENIFSVQPFLIANNVFETEKLGLQELHHVCKRSELMALYLKRVVYAICIIYVMYVMYATYEMCAMYVIHVIFVMRVV